MATPYHESIIIEGPSFSGKTTLANKLSGVTGLPVREPSDYVFLSTNHLIKAYLYDLVDQPCILDGHWVSEHLYAPIVTGKASRLNELNLDAFWDIQSAIGVSLIFCLPKWKLIEESCKKENLEKIIVERIRRIYASYEAFIRANNHRRGALIYDYETGNGTYIVQTLLKTIRGNQGPPQNRLSNRILTEIC